jgi:nucleoside-diphosphate-sugar epimerase
LRTIGKGRFIIFGTGDNLRHPVYISDTVRGLELCAQKEEICEQIFIVAGRKPVSFYELFYIINAEVGRKTSFIQLPVNAGLLISVLMEKGFNPFGKQPSFSRRSMDFFLKNNAYNISKAKLELDYYLQDD